MEKHMADDMKKDDKPVKKTVSVGDVLAKDKAPAKSEGKKYGSSHT
jgi:hypothetical protein